MQIMYVLLKTGNPHSDFYAVMLSNLIPAALIIAMCLFLRKRKEKQETAGETMMSKIRKNVMSYSSKN